MRKALLDLAKELEEYTGGTCEECAAYEQPECKVYLPCPEIVAKYCARRVRAIAEHDADGVTTVSAYDLLSEEDRKAIEWVREHGGLDTVASRIESAEIAADMLWGRGCGRFWTTDDFEEEISKRLMPEGMEWLLEVWPKWSNGEYCKFGDWWTADKYGDYEPKQLRRLAFFTPEQLREWEQDEGDNFGYEWNFMRPSDTTYRPDKVEPPAPKALDADGVEIRVGDKLYDTDTGCGRTVRAINAIGTVEFEGYEDRGWFTRFLTHRAPVFAADARPLHEGEHVYHVETGAELVVKELPKPGEYQAVIVFAPPASHPTSFDPNLLTHQRPVLDADGVEIREGDTVYVLGFDEPLTVRGFAADGRVLMDYHSDDSFGYSPENLTHTKPEPPDTYAKLYEDVHDERCSSEEFVLRCRALAERGGL